METSDIVIERGNTVQSWVSQTTDTFGNMVPEVTGMTTTVLPSDTAATRARVQLKRFVQLAALLEDVRARSTERVLIEQSDEPMPTPSTVVVTNERRGTPLKRGSRHAEYLAAPTDIFEGVVQSVEEERNVMLVKLVSKMRPHTDHIAEIRLKFVVDQDRDLVKPGAVFYLSLYMERRGGTVKNAQEIRFRRLPAWTRSQIQAIREDAKRLLTKLKPRPLAD